MSRFLRHWDVPTEIPRDRPFTSADLRRAGVSQGVLSRLVSDGVLRPLIRGTFVMSDVPDTIGLRAQALALVIPRDAVVTDRTAAWLHGVEILPRRFHTGTPLSVECFSTRRSRLRRAGVQSGTRALSVDDVCTVEGVQVTSPVRTSCDLGRLLWRYDALAAMDGFAKHGVTQDQLRYSEPRFKGMRGVIQLRALVPLVDARAEAPSESALRLHWIDAGLPPPTPQLWVHDEWGARRFRLDLGNEQERFAAEYDGEEFHGPERTAHDLARRAWLADRGWTVLVLTKKDIYEREDAYATLQQGYRRMLRSRR